MVTAQNLVKTISTRHTDLARDRIDENLTTLRAAVLFNTCHFCQHNAADDASVIEQPMYGDVQHSLTPSRMQIQTTWRTAAARVPRCATCKAEQERRHAYLRRSGALGTPMLMVLTVVAFVNRLAGGGVALIVLGAVLLAIRRSISNSLTAAHVKRISDYEPVRELLDRRWAFGERPPNT